MTREERIELIKHLKYARSIGADYTITDEDVDEIIKALEQEHILEQESCEDAISRQAAIDYCYQLINVGHQQGSDEMNYGQERVNQTETILHHLEFIPSITPQPKTGHWQKISADKYSEHVAYYFRYSECGKDIIGEYNYCPNCGCRMSERSE